MLESLCNDVEKSPLDKRTYRSFTLPNKLRVLLVCDREADRAAAALNVSVGFNSDPKGRGGLAHFCEHMLLLCSKKYPEDNSLQKYLFENGGFADASTWEENTMYHFSITALASEQRGESQTRHWEALDRFAQIFIAPLFLESGVEREMSAVNSEFEKELQSDYYRIQQLLRSISNPRSPFHNFACGNLETLCKSDTREALIQFHKSNYSSNVMALVMVAPFDLDLLQEFAVKAFSEVKNKNTMISSMPALSTETNPIYRVSDLGRMCHVCPAQDIRSLWFFWAIESSHTTYKWKPDRYIGGILGYEGERSFLSMLKRRSWAVGLNVDTFSKMSVKDLLSVELKLTKKGLDHLDEIIALFHGYLNFIKRDCVQQWIYEEFKAVASMEFKYVEREDPKRLAVALGRNLAFCRDPKLCLKASKLFLRYSEESIRRVLSDLAPDKLIIIPVAKKFQDVAETKERWFNTLYSIRDLPKYKIEEWTQAPITEEMVLRPPNKFIPTNFDVLGKGNKNDNALSGPECVASDEAFKVYHKLDQTFLIPKANVHLQLQTPHAYESPRALVLATLYKSLLLLRKHRHEVEAGE